MNLKIKIYLKMYYQLINHNGIQHSYFRVQDAKRLWKKFPYLVYIEAKGKKYIGKLKYIQKQGLSIKYIISIDKPHLLNTKIQEEQELEYHAARKYIRTFHNQIGGLHKFQSLSFFNIPDEPSDKQNEPKIEQIEIQKEEPKIIEPINNKQNQKNQMEEPKIEPKINKQNQKKQIEEPKIVENIQMKEKKKEEPKIIEKIKIEPDKKKDITIIEKKKVEPEIKEKTKVEPKITEKKQEPAIIEKKKIEPIEKRKVRRREIITEPYMKKKPIGSPTYL